MSKYLLLSLLLTTSASGAWAGEANGQAIVERPAGTGVYHTASFNPPPREVVSATPIAVPPGQRALRPGPALP